MKKYTFYLLILLALPFNSYSQGIITRTFSSGYVTDTISLLQNSFSELNDSTLNYVNYESSNGKDIDYIVEYQLKKSNLTTSRTDTLWDKSDKNLKKFAVGENQTMYGGYFQDKKNSNYLHISFHTDSLKNLLLYFRDAGNNRIKGDTLFAVKKAKQFVSSSPFVYDSSIYIYTINYALDSSFFGRYDLNGNLLAERIDTYTGGSIGNIQIPFERSGLKSQVHPTNDSLLIFEGYFTILQVFLVDRFTLDTVKRINLSLIQRSNLFTVKQWLSIAPFAYTYDSLGITSFGNCRNGQINISNAFYSLYKLRLDWNENVLSMTDFGPPGVDTRFGDATSLNGDNYITSTTQNTNPFAEAPEYRQLLLIRDSPAKTDSIYLFGSKNHIAGEVKVDNNGDVFVLSQFSNAWTDDSLFYKVTKIPAQLLVSIQEQTLATSITVYPNPTADYLKSDAFKIGEEYQIYTISGQVISSATITNDGLIEVRNLKTGTYFLQLLGKQENSKATMFIKN